MAPILRFKNLGESIFILQEATPSLPWNRPTPVTTVITYNDVSYEGTAETAWQRRETPAVWCRCRDEGQEMIHRDGPGLGVRLGLFR
ncbi:hypothetical protein SESBI_25176 [Sesbania bispinosa]|nr:hypothetical protein SESBI_25176 [Sesbania bispinosa]